MPRLPPPLAGTCFFGHREGIADAAGPWAPGHRTSIARGGRHGTSRSQDSTRRPGSAATGHSLRTAGRGQNCFRSRCPSRPRHPLTRPQVRRRRAGAAGVSSVTRPPSPPRGKRPGTARPGHSPLFAGPVMGGLPGAPPVTPRMPSGRPRFKGPALLLSVKTGTSPGQSWAADNGCFVHTRAAVKPPSFPPVLS
jgi:hypothetical protein